MHDQMRFVYGILLALVIVSGCDRKNASAQTPKAAAGTAGAAGDGSGKPAELVKLSQFGHAGSCDVAAGADGTIHALFTDFKEYGKPAFLYYRASKDGGATWSEPKTISDDESVNSAGFCRVLVDASGRVYAIWKYVEKNALLEGPNGYEIGVLAYRVLDGGTWSKPRLFGDEHHPMVSWFAALDPQGKVKIVYSRADEQVDWIKNHMPAKNANNVDQLVLDGAAEPKVVPLQVARHILTPAEQAAMKAAHKYPAYEETVPKSDGVWNLNGYIADDGRPRFLAERYPQSGHPQTILRFDGKAFTTFYEYKGNLGYNTFNWPPSLLRAADGKEHVIRKPEVSENEVIRDYVVENGAPGDKTDIITNPSPKAKVYGRWTSALANGRIAAMAAVAPNVDVFGPTDLYVTIFDGKGNWSKPLNVTDNNARANFVARGGISVSTSYSPTYAAAATLKDGNVGVILLNDEKTISGLDTVGITTSGRAVTGTSSFSSARPYVSFVKMKG